MSQTAINVLGTRPTAFRHTTGDIFKTLFRPTFGTSTWRNSGCKKIPAFKTFPIGEAASGTNIPFKAARSRVTTMCTHPLIWFALHLVLPLIWLLAYRWANWKDRSLPILSFFPFILGCDRANFAAPRYQPLWRLSAPFPPSFREKIKNNARSLPWLLTKMMPWLFKKTYWLLYVVAREIAGLLRKDAN
jgi:hypothetical protein